MYDNTYFRVHRSSMAAMAGGMPVQVSMEDWELHDEPSRSSPKWTLRSPAEGFFITSDLSNDELAAVAESEDKDKWNKYLMQDNIKKMETISFTDCQLRRVPIPLCNITSLTRIYFTMNELDTLPTEFSQLQNLTNLNLAANRFSRIPDAVGKLRNLKVLSLQRNKLTNEGLDNIRHISQLEELSLASNQLDNQLSESVCKLTALTLLDLRNNRIDVLPDEISNLTELRVLHVRQNNLKRLPASLGKLKHLKLACFAENCIESVKFGSFLRLPGLKDLCFFSNRLENKEELEKFIDSYKMKGKLLRLAENRVEISRAVTCDNPYEYYRHDVTFIHDGTEEVTTWVQRAKQYLQKKDISATIKTPRDKSIDIQRDVSSCHVVIPISTQRFHKLVDETDPLGENLRDALSVVVNRKHLSNFLLVFYGNDCPISRRWFNADSITIETVSESDGIGTNGNHDNEFDELYDKIIEIKGDRVRMSSTCVVHS